MAVKITKQQLTEADQAHTALQEVWQSLSDDLADSSERWRESEAGMTAGAALDQMDNALHDIETALDQLREG